MNERPREDFPPQGGKAIRESRRAAIIRRLKSNRYPLAASVAIFVALYLSNTMSLFAMAASVCIMALVSSLAPVRSPEDRRAERQRSNGSGNDRLRTQTILDSIPDPVIVLNGAGEIQQVNRACRNVFADTVYPGLSALIRFRSPELLALINKALAGGAPEPVETTEKRPIERWFRTSVVPLSAGANKLYLLHFRDMSETRRIDRMRSDFIANASHELRTPLASLAGFIETLSGPARDDAAARDRFLSIMQEQADRMSRLIDDLLSLSRLETALGRMDFEPVDMVDILEHVRTALTPAAGDANVELVADFDRLARQDCRIWGSRDELIQVFTNLTENAIRYGAIGGKIEIVADRAQVSDVDSVSVTIRDYGPGIAEEHIPRLTERFYRVDVESSRSKKGTGLGLAIVKHILTRHQGRLAVRSEVGKGASFTVIIPVWNDENTQRREEK